MKRMIKRGGFVSSALLTLIFIILFFPNFSLADQNITGQAITGKQVYGESSLSIIIDADGPIIKISSPKTRWYHNDTSIPLNYSLEDVSGISKAWYNLDHGSNTTLIGNTSFNVSEGNHTLYFFANDSLGNLNSTYVNFWINNTRFIVIYDNFTQPYDGNSTDFNSMSNEQLQSISNMTLEKESYGKILWNENINLTADSNFSDRVIDLDKEIIIGDKIISINETSLPNLNALATLWFYNVNLNNPQILRNGIACPSAICTNPDYYQGTFRIDVTGFSNYSLIETPADNGTNPPGGGGQRSLLTGGDIALFIYPSTLKVSLNQGEKTSTILQLKNLDTANIDVEMSSDFELVNISKNNFTIEPGEDKEVSIKVEANEDTEPGIYIGDIIIKAKKGTLIEPTKIKIVVVVNSKEKLFDVSLTILPEYKTVHSGEVVHAKVEIKNLGLYQEREDVTIDYTLRDLNNNILNGQEESIAIQTGLSEIIDIQVPESAKKGTYIFRADVSTQNSRAFATDLFYIEKESKTDISWILILLLIIIIALFVVFAIVEYKKFRQMESIARRAVLKRTKIR